MTLEGGLKQRQGSSGTPAPRPDATVVLTESEPTVTLEERVPAVEASDCGNGCGKGTWCKVCRAEIHEEALRWLRELNVVHPHQPPGLSWKKPWSREVLLANR
jgi:hypothetical protein